MDRVQVNVRITEQLAAQIDHKRVEIQKQEGRIPSRSDVVRMAIEAFVVIKHSKR
jgi:Arc/MetJ-type ribon-helix-helix transcriptional regulator